ncbi:benzoylformate decarboxylase [Frankia sp. CcI49]|uniref:benzoylformate decarboxylase n=1 Tax=Frankia sp. CcI49 TaxID=1745382 RepID=UPI00097564D4|nr:benzoylformate decarboxylase [Frankia sp. CcI49]ONH59433.1 benzoylformate decarboxylase [Frankia sp. CcI49]
MSGESTVHDVTYQLLRSLGITTVFGNPGSTEQTFLQDFPSDFTYVLGLQEASVMAMADAFAQVTRRPALVNLHSSAGVGHSIGNLVSAFDAHTPLIVTAGQQHREMVIGEPFLSNREATNLPRPWVKWSYEPSRAQDVPEAFMRACAIATQPPAGPVFLSIPLDDWNAPMTGPAVVRSVSTVCAPETERLRGFARRIRASRRPVLVFGPEVDRSGGWHAAIALAENLGVPVFGAALPDRVSFPEDHPLFQGRLGMSQKSVSDRLTGYDLVVVIGAAVFRYYPHVPGDILPAGTELLHITGDPAVAGAARVGDSVLGDARLAIELLTELLDAEAARAPRHPQHQHPQHTHAHPQHPQHQQPSQTRFQEQAQRRPPRHAPDRPETTGGPLRADEVHAVINATRPRNAALVYESTSTIGEQVEWLPVIEPASFFANASGGLGWAVPAAVGVALGDRDRGVHRPVIGIIGDGAFQYSVQALWTAAQHSLPIVFVVLQNNEYSILKSFAELERTAGVPGLDLPGLAIASLAHGFGCRAVDVSTRAELEKELTAALEADTTTVIVVPTRPQRASLR